MNLTYTNPHATDEQIRQALYASAMDEYVATLPEDQDTVLRENGAGLSEGQAQRISLARAILSGAPVLLPDKTCIAVTHRPAALALADRIITVTPEGMTLTACE